MINRSLAVFFILSFICICNEAMAQGYDQIEGGYYEDYSYSDTVGGFFFGGVGPAIGFESNVLLSVFGGAALHIGYQISEKFSVLLNTDIIYTRDSGVDYIMIPVFPTFEYNIDEHFFTFFGGGYTYMYGSGGIKPGTGGAATGSKNYNGFNINAGFGYDFFLSESLILSPHIGINYSRIASSNLVLPLARINFSWIF